MADPISAPPPPDTTEPTAVARPTHPIRVVARLLAPMRLRIAVLVILTVIGGLAEAVLLVVVAQIAIAVTEATTVDQVGLGLVSWGIPRTLEGLYVMAGCLLIVRLAAQAWAGLLNARAVTETQANLRNALVEAFVTADWATQSRERDGHVQDLVTTHVGRAGSSVSVLSGASSSAISFTAMIGSALVVAPATAGLMFVAVGAMFFVFRPLTAFARRLSTQRAEAGQEMAQHVTEAVASALEIRTTNVPRAVVDELHGQSDQIRDLERRAQLVHGLMPPTYQTLALVVLLAALAGMYAWGSPAAGALGAILLLLLRALSYSQALQISYHQLGELAPYAEEVQEQLALYRAAAPVDGTEHLDHIDEIRLDDVGFAYLAGTPTLVDVDLGLGRGQMLGVIGPSGAGKSTLIQLLLGLRSPTTGRYLVNGIDRDLVELDSWFAHVAFVPQEPRLIGGSIADNIRFWRALDDEQVENAARRAHVHEDVMAMAEGYGTDVGPRGSRLSGGQKQRVTIARALAGDPDLLILDEPTSALDLRSEALLEETFSSLRGELTMVVIAHRLSTISACDRLLVIEGGRVQALGTPTEVETASPFFREALARTRAGFLPDSTDPADGDVPDDAPVAD